MCSFLSFIYSRSPFKIVYFHIIRFSMKLVPLHAHANTIFSRFNTKWLYFIATTMTQNISLRKRTFFTSDKLTCINTWSTNLNLNPITQTSHLLDLHYFWYHKLGIWAEAMQTFMHNLHHKIKNMLWISHCIDISQ